MTRDNATSRARRGPGCIDAMSITGTAAGTTLRLIPID